MQTVKKKYGLGSYFSASHHIFLHEVISTNYFILLYDSDFENNYHYLCTLIFGQGVDQHTDNFINGNREQRRGKTRDAEYPSIK